MANYEIKSKEIERKAERIIVGALDELFRENGFEVIDHKSSKGEVGIDIFFQVLNRENNHDEFSFNLQSKGTNDEITINKKGEGIGKISFQLEPLRHAISWYNNNYEALILAYCDINSNDIYWYSIQIDNSIPERIRKQIDKNVDSLQLYIPPENIINKDNFQRFLSDIHLSRRKQIEKLYPDVFQEKRTDYSFIEGRVRDLHIIDKLNYLIEIFEIVVVLPEYVIENLFFYCFGKSTYISRSDFSLNTSNEDLYNLLNSLQKKENEKTYLLKDGEIYVDNQSEKLKKIIEFLRVNMVNHIYWVGKEPKGRICIHKQYRSGICDCERCNFERLDFKRVETLLQKENNEYTIYEKLKKGYAAYLFGEIEQAIEILYDILENTDVKSKPITYVIVKFNLVQLRRIGLGLYSINQESLDKLKSLELNFNDEILLHNEAQWFLEIYKSIKDYRFIFWAHSKVDDILNKISKTWLSDKKGGWTSGTELHQLKTYFLRTLNFLEYNLIILDYLDDFKSLCKKVLEGLFALYTLENNNTPKYEQFEFSMLQMWIFYVKYDDAKFLIEKYKVGNIKLYEREYVVSQIIQIVKNLNDSVSILSSKHESGFIFKVERIIQNISLIISKIELNQEEANDLLNEILLFSQRVDNKNRFIPIGGIISIIVNYEKIITKENLVKTIFVLKDKFWSSSSNFSLLIKYFVERSSPKEIKNFVLELLKVKTLNEAINSNEDSTFNRLWYAYTFLPQKDKNALIDGVLNELNKKFEPEVWYMAVIFDLLPFNQPFFDKFIETIPNQNIANHPFHLNQENIRLEQAIDIVFKFDLSMDKLKKYSNHCVDSKKDYYTWLMNLDEFDYSKFDIYWLLRPQTKYSFEALKKSELLLENIGIKLKDCYNERISKLYFELIE
jgi:hypothetical protein